MGKPAYSLWEASAMMDTYILLLVAMAGFIFVGAVGVLIVVGQERIRRRSAYNHALEVRETFEPLSSAHNRKGPDWVAERKHAARIRAIRPDHTAREGF